MIHHSQAGTDVCTLPVKQQEKRIEPASEAQQLRMMFFGGSAIRSCFERGSYCVLPDRTTLSSYGIVLSSKKTR